MSHLYDFLPEYPSVNDESFNQKIYNKQEFYDERLSEYPEFPKNKGQYLKHQKIISRFLSSHTPYNGLLLFHEMGTGKTCATIAATEMIKKQGGYKGVLYLAPGRALIDNFKKELAFKCTDGDYIPENYNNTSSVKKRTQMLNKKIKGFYKTNTYETFAKKQHPNFDNHIIVMDEIHNITSEKNTTYPPILKFVRGCKNCKILLLSGTPMKDSGKEIFNVINLILPEEEDIKEEDISKSIVDNNLTEYGIELLKNKFRGRTSYLKSKSKIEKRLQGSVLPNFRFIKLCSLEMKGKQEKIYIDNDDETEVQNFDTKPRQIALSVYPDGSYGKTGFKKYVKTSRKGNFTLSRDFNFPDNDNVEKKIEFVEKLSVKYAETIRLILKARKEKKIVFVYSEFVEGSGLVLFSLLLKKFGFIKATKANNLEPKERFLLLTGTEMNKNKNKIKDLVNTLNSDENSDGSLIRVILGSQVVSEGLTFKNVQMEIVQTPHWNFSRIFQAIARGYRIGAHKALLDKGIKPILDIYLLVASTKETQTIDIKMYNIAERKDILIKQIERIFMESAFDCQLNIKRNRVYGEDGSRDCEYSTCDYKCDGIEVGRRKADLSTYNLYYNQEEIKKYTEKIKKLFSVNFALTFNQIKSNISSVNEFTLLQTLSEIINKNVVIPNKYGMISYLFENDNLYYLGNNLESVNFLDNYYNKYPYVKSEINYKKLVKREMGNPTIKKLCSSKKPLEIRKHFYTLKSKIANFFIEQSVLHSKTDNNILKEILKISSEYIYTTDSGVKYNLYLLPERVSYLSGKEWVSLSGEKMYENTGFVNIFLKIRENIQTLDWHNPYGFYLSVEDLGDKQIYRYIKSYKKGDEIDFIYVDEETDEEKEIKGKIEKINGDIDDTRIELDDGKEYNLEQIVMKKHKVNKGQTLTTLKIPTLARICMAIDFKKIRVDGYDEFSKNDRVKQLVAEYYDKNSGGEIKDYTKWLFLNSKKLLTKEKGIKQKLTQKNLKKIISDFIASDPVTEGGVKLIQNYKITNLIKTNM